MVEVLRACGATRIEASENEAQRLRFWSGRKNAFPASGRISPDYMCMDSTIPRKRLADMLIAIGEMETKYGLRCVNVFHAGDGNLHPLILFDANDADAAAPRRGVRRRDPRAERGDGRHRHRRARRRRREAVVDVRAVLAGRARADAGVKRAFDPAGLLNPGKVIPTLHALRRVRPHARQARPARLSRPAALLRAPARESRSRGDRRARARRARVGNGRCASAAAARKDFYGEAPSGDVARRARAGRRRRPRADRARRHRARPARRSPSSRRCSPSKASACRSSRRASAPASTVGGMVAAGLSGPSRAARRLACATTCSASPLLNGTRRAAALRRPGDQERRRLRRLAPDRRLARHLGVIVEVSLKVLPRAAGRGDAALRLQAGRGARRAARLGRPAAAARCERVVERQPDRAPARRARRGRRGGAHARRRDDRRRPRRRRSGKACATTRDPFFVAADDAIEHQDATLWRLSLPQTAPLLGLAGDELIEWRGAQRWLATALPAAQVREAAAGGRRPRDAVSRPRQVGRRVRAAGAAAARDPRAAEAIVRPQGHPQSRAASIRVCDRQSHRMQTAIAPEFAGTADGIEAEAILRKCVHCGFCTATCPTYQLLGDELDGPRGRIYLIKQVLEGARADALDAAPPRPLPHLPQLRDDLPVGRAVRQPGRDRPAHRRRARAAPGAASARCAGR